MVDTYPSIVMIFCCCRLYRRPPLLLRAATESEEEDEGRRQKFRFEAAGTRHACDDAEANVHVTRTHVYRLTV